MTEEPPQKKGYEYRLAHSAFGWPLSGRFLSHYACHDSGESGREKCIADSAACGHPCATGGCVPAGFWRAVEALATAYARGTCLALSHRHDQRPSDCPFSEIGRYATEALLDALWLRPTATSVDHRRDMVLLCELNNQLKVAPDTEKGIIQMKILSMLSGKKDDINDSIPEVLNSAFQESKITHENILEIVYHCHYSYPTRPGLEREIRKETSVLKEYFFKWPELEDSILIKEASLRMRYKKGERLESFSVCTTDKEELLSVLLWIKQHFCSSMKGKHELSLWYKNKRQEELADYVAGNSIEIKDFKYPFRISKVVVSYKDLENVALGFPDLYDQKGQELAKRGFRVPTLEEWLHFANSFEGQQILQNQYKNAEAYEICQPDTQCDLHINTRTHQLAYLDYEYRRVHPGPLRDGFYRYVQSSVPETDLFPEGYANHEAENIRIKAECEYEDYLEKREPWDC